MGVCGRTETEGRSVNTCSESTGKAVKQTRQGPQTSIICLTRKISDLFSSSFCANPMRKPAIFHGIANERGKGQHRLLSPQGRPSHI